MSINQEMAEVYEEYLRDHIQEFVVTEFLGRGKYKKTHFNLNEGFKAQKFVEQLKEEGGKAMLYGISLPPDRTLPIQVTL